MDIRRVREETRQEHEATEQLMPLGGADLTLELYISALQVLLALISGWEQWAATAAPARLRPLLRARRRSHLIADDLRFFAVAPAAPAGSAVDWQQVVIGTSAFDRDPIAAEASFLGALYVLEGSTLGGRFIARHVETVLGLTPGQGDRYFAGHGEATGALWREVTAEIAGVPPGGEEALLVAARRTFAAFGDALRAGLPTAVLGG